VDITIAKVQTGCPLTFGGADSQQIDRVSYVSRVSSQHCRWGVVYLRECAVEIPGSSSPGLDLRLAAVTSQLVSCSQPSHIQGRTETQPDKENLLDLSRQNLEAQRLACLANPIVQTQECESTGRSSPSWVHTKFDDLSC
jgi:hypothetical protein